MIADTHLHPTLRPGGDVAGPVTTHHVIQDQRWVSDDPKVVLGTLLGSCVAACLRDPVAGIGGMNHFLLPGIGRPGSAGVEERFGVHSMELLVNALLARGAMRSRLEAKLFGGASTLHGLAEVGELNARFALDFLANERIALVSSCLGGRRGRRVQYWPVSGRARRIFLAAAEPSPSLPPPTHAMEFGTVELFDDAAPDVPLPRRRSHG